MSSEDKSRSKNERAQAQRDRILKAAEACFIQHGFHAASMASIAETAEMSAGLIYRYFDSKDAIILAIIERQLVDKRLSIASLTTESEFCARIRQLFKGWQSRDGSAMNAALFLEMSAHASREPLISKALSGSDRITTVDFRDWMRLRAHEAGASPSEQEIQTRTLILQSFIEGLAIRAVREPDYDIELAGRAIDKLIGELLSFEPRAAAA